MMTYIETGSSLLGSARAGVGVGVGVTDGDGTLKVTAMSNRGNPLMDDAKEPGTPILGNGV